eukprot:TRINITY_DN6267_c0_g1_i2.p1 TRINITY_DN6267_c0_g1~~TRINITY_DN6267_c0_g1_i2.p1  ORF type:complete len:122 (-),score=15.53 TRINITY_DN6267_c0_g1_i2:60-425(-)
MCIRDSPLTSSDDFDPAEQYSNSGSSPSSSQGDEYTDTSSKSSDDEGIKEYLNILQRDRPAFAKDHLLLSVRSPSPPLDRGTKRGFKKTKRIHQSGKKKKKHLLLRKSSPSTPFVTCSFRV